MDEIASIKRQEDAVVFTIQDNERKDNVKESLILPFVLTMSFCGIIGLCLLGGVSLGSGDLVMLFGIMELASIPIFIPWLGVSIKRRRSNYKGPNKTVTLDDEQQAIVMHDYPPNDLLETIVPFMQVDRIASVFEQDDASGHDPYVLVITISIKDSISPVQLYRGRPSSRSRELVEAIIRSCAAFGITPPVIDDAVSNTQPSKQALREIRAALIDRVRAEFSEEECSHAMQLTRDVSIIVDDETRFKLLIKQRAWALLTGEIVLLALIPAFVVLFLQDGGITRFMSILCIGIIAGFLVLLGWIERAFPPRNRNFYLILAKPRGKIVALEKGLFYASIEEHRVHPWSIVHTIGGFRIGQGASVYVSTNLGNLLLYYSSYEERAMAMAEAMKKAMSTLRQPAGE